MIIDPNFMFCSVCGKHKSKRVHRKCSRILQQKRNSEDAELIRKEMVKADMLDSVFKSQLARNKKAAGG